MQTKSGNMRHHSPFSTDDEERHIISILEDEQDVVLVCDHPYHGVGFHARHDIDSIQVNFAHELSVDCTK